MKKRVLFLVAEDWYFALHRLAFAKELLAAGHSVGVACRVSDKQNAIEQAGVTVYPVPFDREAISFGAVLRACFAVRRVIRIFRPDLVHLVALRPILIGWMATIFSRRPPFVNVVTGLGTLFIAETLSGKLRFVQLCVRFLLKPVFSQASAFNVFQNGEDCKYFTESGFAPPSRNYVIRGEGIHVAASDPAPEPSTAVPVVLFVVRLLRDKGLGELIEASKILTANGTPHKLRIVGDVDACNPTSFSIDEFKRLNTTGAIEWLGRRSDVLQQMAAAHVVVLPSYREGLPNVLLEAGVAERSVVTCDVIGCREVVQHMVNGLLVPPRDPPSLAQGILTLLRDSVLRRKLASRHRERVCREFSEKPITAAYLQLYETILKGPYIRPAGRYCCN